MNQTDGIQSLQRVCAICQTSYGFSAADQRAIIVLVVFVAVILVGCYVGVLCFTIRTRFIPDGKSLSMMENSVTNQAFNPDDDDEEDDVQRVDPTTAGPAVVITENEKERY